MIAQCSSFPCGLASRRPSPSTQHPPAASAAALVQARGQAAGRRPSCPNGWKAKLVPSSNPATLLAFEKTGLSEITGLLARHQLTIEIMHKPVQAPPHFPDLALLTEVKVPCSERSRDAREQTCRVRDAQVSDQEHISSEEFPGNSLFNFLSQDSHLACGQAVQPLLQIG